MCLSFPITELCLLKRRSDAFLISSFLTDEEQALTGGTVCFKHRLTRHSVFTSDIQCAEAAAPALQCSSSTTFLICIRSRVLLSNVSQGSGLLQSNAKRNKITYHVLLFFHLLRKCSKLQVYTTGSLVAGLHFDTKQWR